MLTGPQRAALAEIVAAGAAGAHHNPRGRGYGRRVGHARVIGSLLDAKLVAIDRQEESLARTCRNGYACEVLVATELGRKTLEETR